MDNEVLATIEASTLRRQIAVMLLAGAAVMVIYAAVTAPPQPVWQLILIGLGLAALYVTLLMWRATGHRIELTRTELRSSDGGCIVSIDEMRGVDRGLFAVKPSNGFVIRTYRAGPRGWRPGLWWRLGRRIGIGGVASAAQTKVMAAMLVDLLAERDQLSDQTT